MQDFSGANSGRVGSLLAKCKGNGFDPLYTKRLGDFIPKNAKLYTKSHKTLYQSYQKVWLVLSFSLYLCTRRRTRQAGGIRQVLSKKPSLLI